MLSASSIQILWHFWVCGCLYLLYSATGLSKIHICAIVVGVRLHFSSYALLASSSQLFSCAGRTCLLGSSTFGVWTGGQGPLLAVEHKTAVESSMKNNYSLGLQNSMPGKWHNQIQPTICWKYGPSIHMLRQKFL